MGQLGAGHFRHDYVRQEQVDGPRVFMHRERLPPVFGKEHAVAVILENQAGEGKDYGFVIGHQDGLATPVLFEHGKFPYCTPWAGYDKKVKFFLLIFSLAAAGLLLAQTPPTTAPPPGTVNPLSPQSGGLRVGEKPALPAAPDPNQVVMTVGDEKITFKQYNDLIQTLPPNVQAAARGPQKRAIAERLVELKVLAKEAEKRNLDQTAAVKQQLAFQRENVLANALYGDMIKTAKVDDVAVRKYYDDHKSEYETAKGRHILIRMKGSAVPLRAGQKELTDEEALAKAQEIRKKLEAGGDFATIAKEESDDVQTGAKGGDLGTFKHGQMVGPFDKEAFTLQPGQLSEPVKTQFGYHLIKIDERTTTPFETARTEIVAKLAPDAAKKDLDEMKKKANVTLDESFFGPAPPAQ